jgi:S-(hydroxymethyl)glutathione dehydrogenase / alcohol dehydrogenase
MRAAVCYEFGQPLVVEQVEIEPPQRGEVKVRMEATAICHSDIHYIEGERAAQPPLVVGHEGAGVVVEIGADVTLVRVGDRVALSLLRQCGRCYFCTLGLPYHCEGTFALTTESRLRNHAGVPLRDGELGASAFAEEAIVDQSQLVGVPDDMPLDRACLLACGVITGAGAVINTAAVRPGSSVVVIGAGGVGLNAIQGAVLAGADPIIVLDTLPSKLEAALEFGATHTVEVGTENPVDVVRSLTGGRGADYAFVTVGTDSAVAGGFDLIRIAGTLVLVGLPAPGVTASLPIREFAWAGQRVLGSCMGSTRLSVDVPYFIELYRQGRLKLDELITARYPLDRINEAIDAVKRGEARRNVIMFDPGL